MIQGNLTGLIKAKQGVESINIFGYSTKGNPGLEIVCSSKIARSLKEKIVYLSKVNRLKIPTRRYVITIELGDSSSAPISELKWLDLPVLLIFWSMAGIIPIKSFDNCFCLGHLDITGEIYTPLWIHDQALVANYSQTGVLITKELSCAWAKCIEVNDILSGALA